MRTARNGDEEGEATRHHHEHTSISEILSFIDSVPLEVKVREDAKKVYSLIAEAESRVHGHPIENVHFHEVGSLDALADVLSVCALMHELAPERILGALCAWHPARSGTGNRAYPARRADIFGKDKVGAVHAYGSCTAEILCLGIWGHADYED